MKIVLETLESDRKAFLLKEHREDDWSEFHFRALGLLSWPELSEVGSFAQVQHGLSPKEYLSPSLSKRSHCNCSPFTLGEQFHLMKAYFSTLLLNSDFPPSGLLPKMNTPVFAHTAHETCAVAEVVEHCIWVFQNYERNRWENWKPCRIFTILMEGAQKRPLLDCVHSHGG